MIGHLIELTVSIYLSIIETLILYLNPQSHRQELCKPSQSSQVGMKILLLCAITSNLIIAAPLVIHHDSSTAIRPSPVKLDVLQKRNPSPEIPPTIPYCNFLSYRWLIAGVREDTFVADIPYPKHLIPKLPGPTSPPRPRSPIDSTFESTVETTESETTSSFEKRKVFGKRSAHVKRGVSEFLWSNKLAVASGAAIMGGGLWLWDRWAKRKAEKQPEMTRTQEIMPMVQNHKDLNCSCESCEYCDDKKGLKIDDAKKNGIETSQEYRGPKTLARGEDDHLAGEGAQSHESNL